MDEANTRTDLGDMVTVFSGALQQPIADLVAKVADAGIKDLGDLVPEKENGYCAAILMLTVLTFESLVARASHVRRRDTKVERKNNFEERNTISYLRLLDPSFPQTLLDEVEELYVLRDALAHGHVWTLEVVTRPHGQEITSRERHGGYGNPAHTRVVDEKTGRTRKLGLNAIPTQIGFPEAAAALTKLSEALQRLVSVNALEPAAVRRNIAYKRKLTDFWTLGSELNRLQVEKHR